MKLFIGGVEHEISISTNENIETITDSGADAILDEGCTLNTTTGALNLAFITALESGTTISIGYTMNMSDTYFVLFDKNMQEDDLQINVSLSEDVEDAFEIVVARWNPINLEYVDAKLIFGLIIFFILFEIFCISFLLISPIIVKVKGDTLAKIFFKVDINFGV